MKTPQIERFGYTPFGTFGTLYLPEFWCYTIELPWHNNQSMISCIPEGVYSMKLGRFRPSSPKGYPAYELINVPNRSLIKVHIANTIEDILGCIGVGYGLGWYKNKWAITDSRKAFNDFMEIMNGAESTQIIIGHKEINYGGDRSVSD